MEFYAKMIGMRIYTIFDDYSIASKLIAFIITHMICTPQFQKLIILLIQLFKK